VSPTAPSSRSDVTVRPRADVDHPVPYGGGERTQLLAGEPSNIRRANDAIEDRDGQSIDYKSATGPTAGPEQQWPSSIGEESSGGWAHSPLLAKSESLSRDDSSVRHTIQRAAFIRRGAHLLIGIPVVDQEDAPHSLSPKSLRACP
jgi:hypothetical protein